MFMVLSARGLKKFAILSVVFAISVLIKSLTLLFAVLADLLVLPILFWAVYGRKKNALQLSVSSDEVMEREHHRIDPQRNAS